MAALSVSMRVSRASPEPVDCWLAANARPSTEMLTLSACRAGRPPLACAPTELLRCAASAMVARRRSCPLMLEIDIAGGASLQRPEYVTATRTFRRLWSLQSRNGGGRSGLFEELSDAAEGQLDVRQVVGVAETEKAFAVLSEGGAGQ